MDLKIKTNNFVELCRVCLKQDEKETCGSPANKMAKIYETEISSLNISLCDMFTSFTALSTEDAKQIDGFPTLICNICLDSLITAYEFQLKCIKSDHDIRMSLGYLPVQKCTIKDTVEKDPIKTETNNEIFEETIKNEHVSEISEVVDSIDDDNIDFEDVVALSIMENDSHHITSSKSADAKVKKKINSHTCQTCNRTFAKPCHLLRHSKIHNSDGKPFECKFCKRRFAVERQMLRHAVTHSKDVTVSKEKKPIIYPCSACSRTFLKQESLSSHMRIHKDVMTDTEYPCKYCTKIFSKLKDLSRHTKVHDKCKRHQCKICNKAFLVGAQLIDHMLLNHKGIKPHICSICNKGYNQIHSLKRHIRNHSGETPYLCSECGKSFTDSGYLKQHMKYHTENKPFQCDECPNRFHTKGILKCHMLTHSGIKPFSCDICGALFTKDSSLQKHKRNHTGERPYSCKVCNRRFITMGLVTRHMRIHTGEKPYICEYCDRAYAQSNDLRKHIRSHVGENTYRCKECPADFRMHNELKKHIQEHYLEKRNVMITNNESKSISASLPQLLPSSMGGQSN